MTVVVGVTSTPLGRYAVEAAAEEARLRRLPVVLVGHIPVPRGGEGDEARNYELSRQRLVDELGNVAQRVRNSGAECSVEVPVASVSPADAIVTVAAAEHAELVVIGIRRRSRVGKLILGSTAQAVLLTTDCPVLGVKAQDDEPLGRA